MRVSPRAPRVSFLTAVAVGGPAALLLIAAHLAAAMRPDAAGARAAYTLWAAVALGTLGISAYLLRSGRGVTGAWLVLWAAGFVAFTLQLVWHVAALGGADAVPDLRWAPAVGLGLGVAVAVWWAIDLVVGWFTAPASGFGIGPRGTLCLVLFLYLLGAAVARGGPAGWLLAVVMAVALLGSFLFRVTVRGAEAGTLTAALYRGFFALLDRFVPWYRLPKYIGALNLFDFRDVLREKNLYDTREPAIPEVPPPATPPFDPALLARRATDGTYNDLGDPLMGAAGTRFGRNVPLADAFPEKEPGLLEPSPRTVSARLLARGDGPDGFVPARTLNLLAGAWIQFMTHDWFHHGEPVTENPFTIPLDGPGDPWPGGGPMYIRRTRPDPTNPGDPRYPPTYRNTGSHWWDGSQVYGNSDAEAAALRVPDGDARGDLRLSPDRLLPIDPGTNRERSGLVDNWWLGLSLMHTLFAQEHNAITARLRLEYPFWDGDRVFHTARLVNTALMAKIHTVEWTPAILGHPTLELAMNGNWWGVATERITRAFGRISDSEFVSGIPGSPVNHHSVPYSLTEEFVSVYRMHPLMPDAIRLHRAGSGRFAKEVALPDMLNEKVREALRVDGGGNLDLDDVCYSFGIAHPGAITLHNYPHFLRRLARPDAAEPHRVIDLAAIDVMRDRERGVPRYNRFRELLRLPPASSFEALTSNPEWARELREVYGDVNRVDAMVGMFAEDPPPGFGFSETAFRIFILMASRRLKSDRFFTTDYTPNVYTQVGLDWVATNTMSSVLLRHFPRVAPAVRQLKNAFAPWPHLDGG